MSKPSNGPPVKQALIAAGGIGQRMGEAMGSAPCKSVIEYRGQTMLGRLLDGLQANGFEDFLVATNDHSAEAVAAVLKAKGIQQKPAVVELNDGFRRVPQHFSSDLDERFLFACGHHPVPAKHIGKLLTKASVAQLVMTTYDNETFQLDQPHGFVVDRTNGQLHVEEKHLTDDEMISSFTYARHPYIVDTEVVKLAEEDNHADIFGTYVVRSVSEDRKLAVVKADFPPEFDYAHELEVTKLHIASRLSI